MTLDDEGDFKKARGFLLTYSCLLLAMWFFQANLTQFNLMGVSLTLEHRKESIWLVLAFLNAYFWFRFWMRVPRHECRFDEPMHDLYDAALVWLSVGLKRRALKRLADQQFPLRYPPGERMKISGYNGEATGRSTLAEAQEHDSDAPELHDLAHQFRNKLILRARYSYTEKGEWVPFPGHACLDYQPSRVMTWAVKAFVIVKGAFVTPWFTDRIAPLVLGGVSTGIALWKWVEVNFLPVA